ncbi:dockerin type I domain-containing protein [Rhodopirellula sp. JC639]|uniref:dockerin type I domain-containing protein n=1 Tax=Stieleria mannarensis TaxID=2755585 RepID=UPI0015FFB9B7|nr:dockerin type I domain-containing protein [Rhodopirellula sp. JC639]
MSRHWPQRLLGSISKRPRRTNARKRSRRRRGLVESLENRRLLAVITSPDTVTVDENQPLAIDVQSTDDLDSEGSGLTYSISGGADQSLFSIDANSGVLQFLAAPDFELPADDGQDNVYDVDVTVTDSDSNFDTQSLQVTVDNVNETPVAEAGGPYAIDAGLTINVDASGTADPDTGDALTYAWDLDQDGTADFTTNNPVAAIPWMTVIDHIGVGSHTIDLTVTDTDGLTSTDSASIDISDLFIFPSVSDGADDDYTMVIDGADLRVNETGSGTMLSRVPIATIANIAVQGSTDRDTLTIDYSGGTIETPIFFDGADPLNDPNNPGVPGDALRLVNAATLGVNHSFAPPVNDQMGGSISIDFDPLTSGMITYTGLEPIIDNLSAVDRVFTFTGGAETITLSDDAVAADNVNRIDSTLGELVDFLNPTNSLTINAGTGDDVIEILDRDSLSAFPVLNVNGDDASDTINIADVRATLTATLNGGVGNDILNVGLGSLDAIDGTLVIGGGANEALPTTTDSVTAKAITVDATLEHGDELNVSDSTSVAAETYTLTDSTLASSGFAGSLTYSGIESLTLDTGSDNDGVTITTTGDRTRTTLNTYAGADTVTVTTTGLESALLVDSGADNDTVNVLGTGTTGTPGVVDASVTRVTTGSGDDDVTVTTTGVESGLAIDTDGGDDVVTLAGSGGLSATNIDTGDDSDVINVRATGTDSATDIFAGAGLDTINVSSDAAGSPSADRAIMRGNPSGVLDFILGDVCVYGQDPGIAAPGITETVTAKTITVTQSYELGDELNISDEGNAVAQTYTLDTTTLTRSGPIGVLTYDTIETLNLETGSGDDIVTITDTVDRTRTTLNTYAGGDTITVTTTGTESVLVIDSGADNDTVNVLGTGTTGTPGVVDASVTRVTTGSGDDDVTVTTTGVESGLAIDTEGGDDVVTLAGSGGLSATNIDTGDDSDVINVRATGTDSATDIFAGAGLDTINLSSDAAGTRSADRDIMRGNPAGVLDDLLGDICVYGQAPLPTTPGITESVAVKTTTPTPITVTQSYELGDELNVSDEGNPVGHSYTLDATVTPDATRLTRVGLSGVLTYETIETMNLETGSGTDDVTIISTKDRTRTTINTYAGADTIDVMTTGDESVLVVDSGTEADTVTVHDTGTTGTPGVFDASVTRVTTGEGADTVTVTTTGVESGLAIDTGIGDDTTTVTNTGMNSATAILLGEGADVANIRGTATGSGLDINGGDGNDTFNITSTADGAPAPGMPDGNLFGNLDAILGDICVFGEGHDATSTPESVSGRQTIGSDVTVTTTVESGDTLNVSDELSLTAQSYAVSATTVRRGTGGTVTYETTETLNLRTSRGDSTVTVASTADATTFHLDTFLGSDVVTISNTGDGSINRISTADGVDDVTIDSTGDITPTGHSSVTLVSTGAANDTVSVNSLGDQAGLQIETDTGGDTVTLGVEIAAPPRTGSAVVVVSAGDDDDTLNVDEVFLNTVVDLSGDAGEDSFHLTAAGSDAAGYLDRLNNDPLGSDAVAATRQLFLDGGDNAAGTRTVFQGVVNNAEFPDEQTVTGVAVGDQVFVNASSATDALDLRYVITAAAQGVLATTTPSSPRATTGNEVFETLGIESVDITSGSANDLLTVTSDVTIDVNLTEHLIDFDGGGGDDKFEIVGTSGSDLITVGTDDTPNDQPFEIDNVEFIRIDGNEGDDQISTQTPALGTLTGGLGSDTLYGGFDQDLLTGGPGKDFLFGGDGNDVLLSDQAFGTDSIVFAEGEVLNGGSQSSLTPGDVCIQVGVDAFRDCEVIGDGGGTKDVLTWLRAIIIPPDAVSFSAMNSPILVPFAPVRDTPAPLLAVTEPSQIPSVVATTSNPPPVVTPQGFAATDVNQDGILSARDALVVINHVARSQNSSASGEQTLSEGDRAKDVNGNGAIEPSDALMVINAIARQSSSVAEGERPLASDWIPAVDSVFGQGDDERFLEDLWLEIGAR